MKSLYLILLMSFLKVFEGSLSAQGVVKPTTLDERLTESELVIEGKIIDQYSIWGVDETMIYTANEIEVYKVFKGTLVESVIEIVTIGGTVDDKMIIAHPSLKLSIGQMGVFMLKQYLGNKVDQSREKIWWPVAENASFLGYGKGNETAKDIFENETIPRRDLYRKLEILLGRNQIEVNDFPNQSNNRSVTPSITNISPLTVNAGVQDLITITGTGFGTTQGTVFFRNADDGGSTFVGSHSYHIQSWTNTQITVWVPNGAGTGTIFVQDASNNNSSLSSQTLTIDYNVINVFHNSVFHRTHLIDDMCDGDGGYRFLYSTNTANNGVDITNEPPGTTDAQDCVERALSTLQAGISFAAFAGTNCGTTTIQSPADDGSNIIGFDNSVWDLDLQASSSTLAVCYSQYASCGSSLWEVVGVDIIIRRDGDPNSMGGSVDWEFGPALPDNLETDMESVVLHELLHGHQIDHVINNGAVMHFSITTGTSNRVLGSEDTNGANDVANASLAYNPPLINCGGDFNCNRQYALYLAGNDCNISLPIELLSFEGILNESKVALRWQTESETNNDFFTLERSFDGRNFEVLSLVKGRGTSSELQYYEFFDENPVAGVNYYRLTQTDFDGTFEVFDDLVAINYIPDIKVEVRPNPVSQDYFQLVYNSAQGGDLEVEIYTITGKLIFSELFETSKELNYFDIALSDWSSGIYIVKTNQNNFNKNIRFVKAN